MRWRVAFLAVTLASIVLGTGFTFPLVPRDPAQQEAVWLMLTVNDFHAYKRGLSTLWDVSPAEWATTGKALSDRDRAYFNAVVVPALGAWHQTHRDCPVSGWNAALLGQR